MMNGEKFLLGLKLLADFLWSGKMYRYIFLSHDNGMKTVCIQLTICVNTTSSAVHLSVVVVGAAKCNELLSLRVAPQGQLGFPQPTFISLSLFLL